MTPGEEAVAEFRAHVEQLGRLCDHVHALSSERDRLVQRCAELQSDYTALVHQRIALESIVGCCNQALGRKGRSVLIERIRSIAEAGLRGGA